jgi:hypothetical protein
MMRLKRNPGQTYPLALYEVSMFVCKCVTN